MRVTVEEQPVVALMSGCWWDFHSLFFLLGGGLPDCASSICFSLASRAAILADVLAGKKRMVIDDNNTQRKAYLHSTFGGKCYKMISDGIIPPPSLSE